MGVANIGRFQFDGKVPYIHGSWFNEETYMIASAGTDIQYAVQLEVGNANVATACAFQQLTAGRNH